MAIPELGKPTLVLHPDPLLRVACQPIEDREGWDKIAENMLEAMVEWKGCGLAAPQVGLTHRMFVLFVTKPMVCLNPELLDHGGQMWEMVEGCLSLPGVRLLVERPRKIKVRWEDLEGKKHVAQFEGMTGRAFLHELDHLNGRLITDHGKEIQLEKEKPG